MNILLVHNYPKGFATGGEGHVFEDEAIILESNGHKVNKLFCSNSEATESNIINKFFYFKNATWSTDGYKRMESAIKIYNPDVIHVHNYYLILSPSIFQAAYDNNIPVVVTLHNYRMISPCSQLLRKNKICELCVGRNPWRILLHRCYKTSFWASLLRYRIYYSSRKKYNWERYVDLFIALTDFAKSKFIEGRMNKEKIYVVPNCIHDPKGEKVTNNNGYGALFVGRISKEKGISQLIEAWRHINYPLTVVGEGSLQKKLEKIAPENVNFVGLKTRNDIIELYKNCAFVVIPSIWYEGLPLVSIEAMAMGRAIAASGHGALSSIVEDGITGLHFKSGDISDMREKIQRLINDNELTRKLGQKGRERYLEKYTPQKHYENLITLYEKAISNK